MTLYTDFLANPYARRRYMVMVEPRDLTWAGTQNLLVWSEDLTQVNYTKTNIGTPTVYAGAKPTGVTAADTLRETAVNATHYIDRGSISAVASSMYYGQCVVQADGRTKGRLRLGDNIGFLADAPFDLTAGTVTGAGTDKGIVNLGGGWFRIWVRGTTNVGASLLSLRLILWDAASAEIYLGDITKGVIASAFDLKKGTVLAPYIATTAGATTSTGDPLALYYSIDGFVSAATDSPASTYFEPRVVEALTFSRSLFSEGRIGGASIPGYGAMAFNNGDGGLDGWIAYSFAGRPVTIWLGGEDFSLANCGIIFKGTCAGLDWGQTTVSLRLRDLQYRLDRPLQANLFGGTGGWEGGADYKGKPKPSLLGIARRVEPVAIDPANLRYVMHNRAITSILGVWDRGVALTFSANYASLAALDAAVIAAGSYATCLAAGSFRLGGSPAGRITASGQGDSVNGTTSSFGDLTRIVGELAGLAVGTEISTTIVTAMNALNSDQLGFYATEETTGIEVIDQFANSIGAWWGFNRAGVLDMGRLRAPVGPAVATFTDEEIISFERLSTRDVLWRLVLGYGRTWSVHGDTDLATSFLPGGLNAATAPLWTEEYRRSSPATDSNIKVQHLMAVDEAFDTLLDESADADAEATRQFAMYSVVRDTYRVVVKTQPFMLELGDEITIQFNRYGLTAGKLFAIIGMTEDSSKSQVELEVWG
jgi:hypothetical protein